VFSFSGHFYFTFPSGCVGAAESRSIHVARESRERKLGRSVSVDTGEAVGAVSVLAECKHWRWTAPHGALAFRMHAARRSSSAFDKLKIILLSYARPLIDFLDCHLSINHPALTFSDPRTLRRKMSDVLSANCRSEADWFSCLLQLSGPAAA
jgi:hypothetical protein